MPASAVEGNTINFDGSPASGAPAGSTIGDGVYIDGARGNTFVRNQIRRNGVGGPKPSGVGVYLFDGASGNIVANNVIQANTAYGILVFNSASNLGTIPRNGPTANMLGGDGIADFREFTGPTTQTTTVTAGTKIPKLCATDMLDAFGSCRLCLVEIEGRRSPDSSDEDAGDAGTPDWWDTAVNVLYCHLIAGAGDPAMKERGLNLLRLWKRMDPELGGEPYRRRLLALEAALQKR